MTGLHPSPDLACGEATAPEGRGELAPAALRLSGLAGAVLGWSPDAFWAATPAELAAVVRALAGEAPSAALDLRGLATLRERLGDG